MANNKIPSIISMNTSFSNDLAAYINTPLPNLAFVKLADIAEKVKAAKQAKQNNGPVRPRTTKPMAIKTHSFRVMQEFSVFPSENLKAMKMAAARIVRMPEPKHFSVGEIITAEYKTPYIDPQMMMTALYLPIILTMPIDGIRYTIPRDKVQEIAPMPVIVAPDLGSKTIELPSYMPTEQPVEEVETETVEAIPIPAPNVITPEKVIKGLAVLAASYAILVVVGVAKNPLAN